MKKPRSSGRPVHKPAAPRQTGAPAQKPTVTTVIPPRAERWPWLAPTSVFIVLMLLYITTMPVVVTFEDSGFFILNCYNGSIAHPPGYPLYSLLCYPFSHLPFASPAINLNLLSALLAALACALLYNITVSLLGHPLYGYIAALAWGLCDAMWAQAIIPEVYSLNALLFMLLLKLALMVRRDARPQTLAGMALAYGLALSNHWPLIVLSTPALLLVLWRNKRQIASCSRRPHLLLSLLGALGLGLSPYIYLVIRGNSSFFVDQYGAMDSLAKVFHYIGRSGYAGIDQQSVGWDSKLAYMQFLLADAGDQYGWVMLILAGLGFICQWRLLGRGISAALTLTYMTTSWLLVVAILNFEHNALMVHVVSAYTGIAYAAFALWGAVGIRAGWDKMRTLLAPPPPLLTVTSHIVLIGVVGSVAAANYADNDRHNDTAAYDFAQTVLSNLDDNATLLIDSDEHFPLRALNQVQGVRPDITLHNIQGILENNSYDSPWTNTRQQRSRVRSLIRHAPGAVYYFSPFDHGYGIDDFGLYKRIQKQRAAGATAFRLEAPLLEYMADLNTTARTHLWNRQHFKKVKGHLARLLVGFGPKSQETQPWVDKLLQNDYYGPLAFVTLWLAEYYPELLEPQGRTASQRLLDILKSAHQQMDSNTPASEQAQRHYLKGMVLYATALRSQLTQIDADYLSNLESATTDAEQEWLRSLALHATADNPAWSLLLHLYTQLQQPDKIDRLQARYPSTLE